MNTRETFMQHVRQAVVDGNRAGTAPPLPERRGLGYQGGGDDLVARFCAELTNAGGCPHVASDSETAWHIIREIIESKAARKIVMGRGGMIDAIGLAGRCREDLDHQALEVTTIDLLHGPESREVFFGADVGISNVEHLVAETGSVVMATSPADPRSLSLLPPVHIAIAGQSQLLPDLFDLFDLFSPLTSPGKLPPSCLTLITGPSKTGDIELRLVTGVRGQGRFMWWYAGFDFIVGLTLRVRKNHHAEREAYSKKKAHPEWGGLARFFLKTENQTASSSSSQRGGHSFSSPSSSICLSWLSVISNFSVMTS